MTPATQKLVEAVRADNASAVRDVFAQHPEVKAHLDEPLQGFAFDSTALLNAVKHGNRQMIDVLLDAGADINARSRWWAGGFGVLDSAEPSLASYLIERGAVVDAHAASRLGMVEKLREIVAANPGAVHSRGGDGQTPLHVASTVEIAQLLLERGADIDARDVDHEATPAQYMIRERQEIARFLVGRGCTTDILMASALGDMDLVRRHLDRDPAAIHTTVSETSFPKKNPHSGGIIYIWTLGAYKTAHLVAQEFNHKDVWDFLMSRSPTGLRLAMACEAGDETTVRQLLAETDDPASMLADDDLARLAYSAQNNKTRALRLMLSAGWSTDVRGQHGATPLHWAAFHGNVEMVREILRYRPDLEIRDEDHGGTPLGWAVYGSLHGWHCTTGDYAGTVEALLNAGANTSELTTEGTEPVKEVLRRFGTGGSAQ